MRTSSGWRKLDASWGGTVLRDQDGAGFNGAREMEDVYLDKDLYGSCITVIFRLARDGCSAQGLKNLIYSASLLFSMYLFQVWFCKSWEPSIAYETVADMEACVTMFNNAMYAPASTAMLDETRFRNLTLHARHSLCSSPLGHPYMTWFSIFIWTCTVSLDVRRVRNMAGLILLRLPTVQSMDAMFATAAGKVENPESSSECDESSGEEQPLAEDRRDAVVGITLLLKCTICCIAILPRLLLDALVLWLGCDFLFTSKDLETLWLNAVAMEFVLVLKDLFFLGVLPLREVVEMDQWYALVEKNHPAYAVRTWITGILDALLPFICVGWGCLYLTKLQTTTTASYHPWDVRRCCIEFCPWGKCTEDS